MGPAGAAALQPALPLGVRLLAERPQARAPQRRLLSRCRSGAMTPVLKATGISVRFGGVHAVVDVDLEVGDGQLVGLIGPNGAGKTTFIDAISGFVRCDGRVELDGADLTGGRRTFGRDAASRGRGSRSSCSTTSRSARTSSSPRTAPRSGERSGRRSRLPARTRPRSTPVLALLGLEETVEQAAERAVAGPAQARRDRAGARRRSRGSSASTSRPPGSTRARARSSAAGCAASPTTARRCCWSTTTWVSCSGSATRWSCWSSAR